jgi:TrmH family RNA methyltransferase
MLSRHYSNPNMTRKPSRRPLERTATQRDSGEEVIRSRDNQWVKRFRAALREAVPPSAGQISVEGPHLVGEALRVAAGGLTVDAILIDTSGERHLKAFAPLLRDYGTEGRRSKNYGVANGDRARDAAGDRDQRSGRAMPRILRTTDDIFRSLAGTETPQGIAALVRLREYSLDDLFDETFVNEKSNSLLVVLVGVQDPGNVGTAVRSAEGFGASGLVATKGTAHPWSQKALRASSGSALRLPIAAGISPAELMAQLHARAHAGASGLRISAACVHPPAGRTAIAPEQTDLRGPVALLIGNEAAGLDESVLRSADTLIRVPLAPPVESLNAGVAASLLLYEAARQRGTIK